MTIPQIPELLHPDLDPTRTEALRQAVKSWPDAPNGDSVVARARKFEQYLRGRS